ncbi:MAG TPA: cobalamin-binding protein [Anaerolineales bacterium]|nr:cobalamin-binding protein [Anaerolineales bacterium]
MTRRPLILTSLIILAVVMLLSACTPQASITPAPSPTEPASESLELTDGLGRVVTLPTPAQRIVSLAPSNTEILFALGAGAQVVGRDEFSDYPAEAASLPSVGGGFGDYSSEAIVALEPELVLAAEINPPELVQSLEELGLVVYLLPNPNSLDELYTNLETVARLTDRKDNASALITALKARVAAVEEKIAATQARPKVFYELDGSEPNAPWTAGPDTFIDTLIQVAGGQNVASGLEGQYAQLSVEALLVQAPEIILLGDAAYGVTPESVAARPGWEAMPAVQNGQLYVFDDNLVSRPSPRLVDGLEQLARLIHPEIFK